MATPRSLRSFFDSTPPDLLDTPLPSLILLSRASHEQTQSEITTLRAQLSEQQQPLSFPDAISFNVHSAHLESLERKNEDLTEQNRKLALAVETAEAKGRALMAEVKNMRDRLQPTVVAAKEESEKRYKELEVKYYRAIAELEAKPDNRGEELLRENEKLLGRLKSYETGNASLNKTISVLKTVVKTNEQSNVELQKKNLDLVAEINTLESQYESAHKKSILLESKYARMEDEKRMLESRLSMGVGDRGLALEADLSELTNSNLLLEQKINELVDIRKSLEAKIKYLLENNKHLADQNLKLHDAKKAIETKTQQLYEDKTRLELDLRKIEKLNKIITDLESTNKNLTTDNSYLTRKTTHQSTRIQTLENETTTLQERSSRMMLEIHTLRDDKTRLDNHLDDLIRQQRNHRRHSLDNPPTSPRGTKRPADSTPPRSLFDRIAIPSPPSRPQLDREIDSLISTSSTSKRGVFCRFNTQPGIAELLSLISGGPLESVRMALEKDVAFLWFLRPADAATFMTYARTHINGGKTTLPHPRGEAAITLEFVWNEKPVRPLERDIASHVVRYGASRTFAVGCVPYEVSLQRIVTDVGGKRYGFWLREGEPKDGGREVVVEFTSVRDAVEARKRLGGEWGEAVWVKEGCDRAVPG